MALGPGGLGGCICFVCSRGLGDEVSWNHPFYRIIAPSQWKEMVPSRQLGDDFCFLFARIERSKRKTKGTKTTGSFRLAKKRSFLGWVRGWFVGNRNTFDNSLMVSSPGFPKWWRSEPLTTPTEKGTIPASSKGCCLNPKGWCTGTPYHPFSTPWKIQVMYWVLSMVTKKRGN